LDEVKAGWADRHPTDDVPEDATRRITSRSAGRRVCLRVGESSPECVRRTDEGCGQTARRCREGKQNCVLQEFRVKMKHRGVRTHGCRRHCLARRQKSGIADRAVGARQ
jgi:hypothetical protein